MTEPISQFMIQHYTADGEYTAGEPNAFTAIPVRYSSGVNGDWNNTATWSATAVGGPGGASIPDGNTMVVIGDATHNHTVIINQNRKGYVEDLPFIMVPPWI